MEKQPANHGEGDPEAADRFNTAERDFVNSDRGREKIKEGPHVSPEEAAQLAEAERRAGERAKK